MVAQVMNRELFIFSLCLVTVLTGCDRIRPEDRDFFEQREREREKREAVIRRAGDVVAGGDVIQRVKIQPSENPELTTEVWLQKEIESLKGQVMFPRWSTTRWGSYKQEVNFSFVHIDTQNRMNKITYTWQVDVLDMTVEPPQVSRQTEHSVLDQSMTQQALRRAREYERQLE